MSAVEWNKKEELVADQAMKHIKIYCPLLATVAKSGKAELTLMVKIQEYCYGNVNFMKSFQKIIVMLYKSKILLLIDRNIVECICYAYTLYKSGMVFIIWLTSAIFLWNFKTLSEQVKNDLFKRGCGWFQVFSIIFSYLFPVQNHPWSILSVFAILMQL